MIISRLYSKVLLEPANTGCDDLFIVSGYASPAMAYRHFADLPTRVNIRLIIGMTSEEGILRAHHMAYRQLAGKDFKGRFECRYVATKPAVHSKIYIWSK